MTHVGSQRHRKKLIIIVIICQVDHSGPSLGGIADSNPAGAWMIVESIVVFQVENSATGRSRGVVPIVVCLSVIADPEQ
jgi:hypothetical protein